MGHAIRMVTAIPGPQSQRLWAERQMHVPRGPFHATPVFIARGEGAMLTDVDGNRFIDFAGGIGVLNVGYSPPQVVRRIAEQSERYIHACFHVVMYPEYVELARALNELTPGGFPKKTFLTNSGAEAVENAVKIARAHTHRLAVVCFEHAFHGRTLLGMSLTSKVHPYKAGFGPFAPEIYRVPFPYCYRCPMGLSPERCAHECADYVEDHLTGTIGPENIAALIIEPVLGEGGFVPAPEVFIRRLTDFCRTHGIVTIDDEIQTGFARTGTYFAAEHYGWEPDIVLSAKSIAAGLPLSAVTGRAEIMEAPEVGGIGGTYAGNPVACASALEVIRLIKEHDLCERAREIGREVERCFRSWQKRYPIIGDVRGLGAMMALELVTDRRSRKPAKELTGQIIRHCYENGLIIMWAGTYGNVIRTLMPLVITDEQLGEGLSVLEEGIRRVSDSQGVVTATGAK